MHIYLHIKVCYHRRRVGDYMTLNEQYLLYRFAEDLVKEQKFNLLYINEKANEVWLEKYENRTSTVIRLIHKGFDWKNYLKKDIAFLIQRIRNIKRVLGKNIKVYNLYFTTHAPIDSWELLKKPLKTDGKPEVKMKVYYLSKEDFSSEKERFEKDLAISPIHYNFELTEESKENVVKQAKDKLIFLLHNKRKETENIFRFGKPILTFLFIVINLLYYFYMEMNGDTTSIETLIQSGAKYNPAIIGDGEWWRLITSMFIHIGFIHLALNMLAIFYLGSAIERIFGSSRFLLIYFIAGIGGSIASFAFTTSISAGASGAIFGLFGAFIYFGIIHKRLFFQTIGTNILLILAINLVIGLSMEQVDMAAHVGGLIGGFLAAAIVGMPKRRHLLTQFITAVVTVILFFSVTYYGVEANESDQSFQLLEIEESIMNEEYEEVVTIATDALTLEGELESVLLFQRSYAYIELEMYDEALVDLERSVEAENPLPQAYYNLALLYHMNNQEEEAVEAIEQAYRMNPTEEEFYELYEEITGGSPSE